MPHLYLSLHANTLALQKERQELMAWCEENGVKEYCWIEENIQGEGRVDYAKVDAMYEAIPSGETIVISSLSRLGRSLPMIVHALKTIMSKNLTLVCLDGACYSDDAESRRFVSNLQYASELFSKVKKERAEEAIFEKRSHGGVLGRPAGARTRESSRVLYGKYELVQQLHRDGVSAQKIANAVGVSRGTIANYLKTL